MEFHFESNDPLVECSEGDDIPVRPLVMPLIAVWQSITYVI